MGFITAWAYEAGVKTALKGVNADVAFYRMDVSAEQPFDPVTLEPSAGGASRRQGVELGLHARAGRWIMLHGSWTFNDAKYLDFITPDGDTLTGRPVFNTSKYVGAVAATVGPETGRWSVTGSVNAVGPYSPFDEPGVELPAYGLAHLSAYLRLRSIALELGIRNLFDHKYPELRAGGFMSPG